MVRFWVKQKCFVSQTRPLTDTTQEPAIAQRPLQDISRLDLPLEHVDGALLVELGWAVPAGWEGGVGVG